MSGNSKARLGPRGQIEESRMHGPAAHSTVNARRPGEAGSRECHGAIRGAPGSRGLQSLWAQVVEGERPVSSTLSTAPFIEWFSGSARFLISLLFTSSPAGCGVYFNTVLDCLPTKCDTCPTNRHFPFCSSYRVFPLALNCRDGRVLPAQPGPHAQGCLPRGPSFPPPSSSL